MTREELYNAMLDLLDDYDADDVALAQEIKRHLFRSDINVGIIVCRGGRVVAQEIEVPLLDGDYYVTITQKE